MLAKACMCVRICVCAILGGIVYTTLQALHEKSYSIANKYTVVINVFTCYKKTWQ